MKNVVAVIMLLVSINGLTAQKINLQRIEPPDWWVDMKNPELQLLVHGENISKTDVVIKSDKVRYKSATKLESPNYLFINLEILPEAKPGSFDISFQIDGKEKASYTYNLGKRNSRKRGFSQADLIYLLMPDRFADGNPDNNNMPGMREKADRNNLNGRHGGDIKGIADNLDYIQGLGTTTLWINPLIENNNTLYSYHGYGATDFYKIDSRFGTMQDYLNLVDDLHKRDMKVIIDMIFNHCSSEHWWMEDLPSKDWINHDKNFRTSYRAATVADPHVSAYDLEQFNAGWFVEIMPDMNQHNPYLAKYLIQNSLWWVETADIDGIRMDTHPYPFKDFMTEWVLRLKKEYPDLTILGETWLPYIAFTAYFSGDSPVGGDYNSHLDCITDFPLHYAFESAFNEDDGWKAGLSKFYYTLARDFLYGNPDNNVIFLDNHDVNRHFSSVEKNVNSQKMGIAMLLTLRGIPMLYYGTEYLSFGWEHEGHGHIRKDFPGGWAEDKKSVPERRGLSDDQIEVLNYTKKIAEWRKNCKTVHTGDFMHFVPENDVYVYFRYTENAAVMVLVNNHDKESRMVSGSRFNEILKNYKSGIEITLGNKINDLNQFTVPAKSVIIIELQK